MKKRVLVLWVAAACILAWAGMSHAVITGTSHDLTVAPDSGCGVCHIPHGAVGKRLFPAAGSAGSANVIGDVAGVCGYCHYNATISPVDTAVSENYVYGVSGGISHGVKMVGRGPWSTTMPTTLPYTSASLTNIECTSCHNVHDDTNKPFLRASLDTLCYQCHVNRHFIDAASGDWNGGFGINNSGTHPVGDNITTLDRGSNSPITLTAALFNVARSGSGVQDAWALGGHLTVDGGVTCVTCHAVHGGQSDTADSAATTYIPNANFLVLSQAIRNIAGRTVADGSGGWNALCEGCHRGAAIAGYTVNPYYPNPGNTGFTHPVDNFEAANNANITAFPTNWPTGTIASYTPTHGNPVPICESCHQPHPLAAMTPSPMAAAKVGVANTSAAYEYILRDDVGVLCGLCHTATLTRHHPVGITYNRTGVTYLPADGGTLGCNTCHGGTQGGAHNWGSASFPTMASGWIPANNAKSDTIATDMYNADMGKTCMDCHYTMQNGSNARQANPTFANGITGQSDYNLNGLGTHYIGAVHLAATNWRTLGTPGTDNAPLINIFNTAAGSWTAAAVGGNATTAGWSRWGGTDTAPVMVCESCHELEPDKNVQQQMLLGVYVEGQDGQDGITPAGRDAFCEACHGFPAGTHPVTGKTVERTGAVLSTATGLDWLRDAPVASATWDTNMISCDSCHQPHDANTVDNTFIIDGPATIAAAPFSGAAVIGTVGFAPDSDSATTDYPILSATAGYATKTVAGRGGAYTVFCDQCHTYAYPK